MAKIALDWKPTSSRPTAGSAPDQASARTIAEGAGWSISDVVCTSGPQDRPFEEQHSGVCIAVVLEGSFQYRSRNGREMLTPGSLLLGSPGQYFECGHEYATGDRCISFRYAPDYFAEILAETDLTGAKLDFRALRLPPLRSLASVVTQTASLKHSDKRPWEELGVQLAVKAATATGSCRSVPVNILPTAEARVTRVVRMIEQHPDRVPSLGELATEVRVSRYHFLRTFKQLTGVTPHQYLMRTRLRNAATRLAAEPAKVLDIALDSGFGDVSNFNHAFRAEFGVTPLVYRRQAGRVEIVK